MLFLYVIILFMAVLFSPIIAVVIVVTTLIFLKVSDQNLQYGITFLLLSLLIIVNAIDAISIKNFVIVNDDFSAYYNNYLSFLDMRTVSVVDGIFEFGMVEIGLPTLNYLLSLLIGSNEPYVLKFFYAIIQLSLLFYCCMVIAKNKKMTARDFTILCCVCFVFYKSLLAIQISRQTFSSFMIVLGIFSDSRRKTIFFYMLAIIFHSSAIFLYPLSVYLFQERKLKDFYLSAVVAICGWVFIQLMYQLLLINIINIPVLNKLDFAFQALQHPEMIKQSVLTSLLLILYLMPLVGYTIIRWGYSKYKYNVFILILVLVIYCKYAGFINRIFILQLYIFLGYYYYFTLFENNNKNKLTKYIFILCCFLFLLGQSHYKLTEKDTRFPLIGDQPLYFLDNINEKQNFVDRFKLENSI